MGTCFCLILCVSSVCCPFATTTTTTSAARAYAIVPCHRHQLFVSFSQKKNVFRISRRRYIFVPKCPFFFSSLCIYHPSNKHWVQQNFPKERLGRTTTVLPVRPAQTHGDGISLQHFSHLRPLINLSKRSGDGSGRSDCDVCTIVLWELVVVLFWIVFREEWSIQLLLGLIL